MLITFTSFLVAVSNIPPQPNTNVSSNEPVGSNAQNPSAPSSIPPSEKQPLTNTTSQTLGISYDQMMNSLSDLFIMEKSNPIHGHDYYLGKTSDGTATLEIFGDKQSISATFLSLEIPKGPEGNPIPVVTTSVILKTFLNNAVPGWKDSSTWIKESIGKISKENKLISEEKKVYGNKLITMFMIRPEVEVMVEPYPPIKGLLFGRTDQEEKEEALKQQQQEAVKDQIKKFVSGLLKGETNQGKQRLRNVNVIPQAYGGWGVFVDFNPDDNFKTSWIRDQIEETMSDIYVALYKSPYDIRQVGISAYWTLVDKYGNKSEHEVYVTNLKKDEAGKINWNAEDFEIKHDIIPKLWTIVYQHHEFKN